MRTRFADAAQHADAFFVIRAISILEWSRSGFGSGFCIFSLEPERSRSDDILKKLGAGSKPESDFKVVF